MIEFPCQHCGTYLEIGIEEAGKECSCPLCGALTTPDSKHHATQAKAGLSTGQRITNALQMFGLILFISFIFGGLVAPLGVILLVAGILFLLFFIPGYVITTLGTDWLHREDDQYQEYRKAGGQPYLDNMGFGQSKEDWKLPYDEPNYDRGFVPPRSWAFQCLSCFARVEFEEGECWNCDVQLSPREKMRFPLDT